MSPKTSAVMQFKITLQEIKPRIWRQIQVPSTYTFWDLHVAIQDAMGWHDYHLHDFKIYDPHQDLEVTIGIPDKSGFDDGEEIQPGWKVKINRFFLAPKFEALYLYDFGDGWEHRVVLEKFLPAEKGQSYPRCIAGKRKCPPEDCGGPYGYQELLEILADPSHDEHENMLEWLGGEFDPEKFDPKEVRFSDPKKRLDLVCSIM